MTTTAEAKGGGEKGSERVKDDCCVMARYKGNEENDSVPAKNAIIRLNNAEISRPLTTTLMVLGTTGSALKRESAEDVGKNVKFA